jgi:lactam utilization protein B
MGEIVTLTLPEQTVRMARQMAEQTHRSVEEVLIDWIDRSAAELPLESLPDDELLAIADLQMSPNEQSEFSELLARNSEGALTEAEQARFEHLMQLYRRGMVRKADAIRIAVKRGLKPPLG